MSVLFLGFVSFGCFVFNHHSFSWKEKVCEMGVFLGGGILGVIDLRVRKIPLTGLIILAGLSLLSCILKGEEAFFSMLIGFLLGAIFFWVPRQKRWLGEGDWVVLTLFGGVLLPILWPFFLGISGLFGAINCLYVRFFYGDKEVPFIPCLMGGLMGALLLKNNLLTFLF